MERLRGAAELAKSTPELERADLLREMLRELALCIETLPTAGDTRQRAEAASRIRTAAFQVWVAHERGDLRMDPIRDALETAMRAMTKERSLASSAAATEAIDDLKRELEALPAGSTDAPDRARIATAFAAAARVLLAIDEAPEPTPSVHAKRSK